MKLNFPVYLTLRALRTLGLVVTAPLWVLVMLLVWLLLEVVVMPIADWIAEVRAGWKKRQ